MQKKNWLGGFLILTWLTGCSGPAPATPVPSATPRATATLPPTVTLIPATQTPAATATHVVSPTEEPLVNVERYTTRVPGTLTPLPVFPTIAPVPRGQRLWITGKPMPTSRMEMGSAVVNGKIYVAGGFNAGAKTYVRMEVYDPATNTWSIAAPMPLSRHHFGMAELNGKIYISGGLPDFFRFTRSCMMYDPETDTWTDVADLPIPLGTHSMAALNGKLYVMGGANAPVGGGPMRMMVYDPPTDTWEFRNAPLLPTGREHLAVVAAEGKLYVLGGRIQQSSNLAIVEIYDPQTNTWERGPDMPTATSGFTAAYLDGKIHVAGGEDLGVSKTFNQHEVLDLKTMTWEKWPNLPGARHGLTSQVVNGQWIVIGGGPVADIAQSNRVDIFTP